MVRIAISLAYQAIAASLTPDGEVRPPPRNAKGERLIHAEAVWLNRLGQERRSDVILRLVGWSRPHAK
jgi:hypothetical protein